MAPRPQIFVVNDPQTSVINRALAQEIGLTPSVILMQLAFLISISDNERDGHYWTYQSLSHLRDQYFPYWSKPTIGRAIQELVERDLLIVGNYNRAGFDRTPWYALNPEGLAKLSSLRVDMTGKRHETPTSQYETTVSQAETSTHQAETSMSQYETSTAHPEPTIPETTSEITQREKFTIPEFGISSDHFWHALLDAVEAQAAFPRAEVDTWLRPAHLAGRDGDALVIAAPNKVARDRLDGRMLPQLRAVAAARFGAPLTFRVVVA